MKLAPRRVQAWLSRATLILVGLGSLYLWTRYEILTLPSESCSPLTRLAPGSSLWLDRFAEEFAVGDVLLFDSGGGELSLAELERREGDSLWLVTDVESCPGASSAELGWIPVDRVEARLILAGRF